MRRRLLAMVATFAVAAGTALVTLGPATLRPWRCHHAATRSTPREAAEAYYASCWGGPSHLVGPHDGYKESTAYAEWFAVNEFTVVYRGGKTRFLLVGQESVGAGWRALPPEGTGP